MSGDLLGTPIEALGLTEYELCVLKGAGLDTVGGLVCFCCDIQEKLDAIGEAGNDLVAAIRKCVRQSTELVDKISLIADLHQVRQADECAWSEFLDGLNNNS